MVNCLLSVNQYAVDNIRSLVKGGLNTMARSGLKATGSVYGYEKNEDKALGVVKSEAVVVSKIFKLYSQHQSLGKVAHTLNRQKVLTRRSKPFSPDDHQEHPQQQDLHRSDRPQWGGNEGYSPTDYLDSAVESL